MAAKQKTTKQKTTKKQSGSSKKKKRIFSLEEFFVQYLTALLKHNTRVALETGALPQPIAKGDRENWQPNNGKCGVVKGKKRCGGTIVPLDTEHGPGTNSERGMCDRCGVIARHSWIWTRQNFSGSKDSDGIQPQSIIREFALYVERGLIDLPEFIAELPSNERWIPAVQYVSGQSEESPYTAENAPIQQRRIAGGFSIGVTEQVVRGGKAKGRAAPQRSDDELIAQLDF